MHSFTIFVDSNCDLPAEYMAEHDIHVLPIPFDLDGKPNPGGYWQDISGKEFYDSLRHGGVSKTSQVNPETFFSLFTEYAGQNKPALFIALSSGLSGTYGGAVLALQEVKETYPECDIHVVDSIFASSGHGLAVMLAVKKRDEGWSAGETAALLEEKKHRYFGLFTVEDLMYLHRGGRLSKLSAIAGSMLKIRPILNLAPDGTLALKEKAQGRKASMKLMVSQLQRSIKPDTVMDVVVVNHTDCLEDAQILAGMVKEAVNVREVLVMFMGPVIGTHLGPGALTLIFEADMTRAEYEAAFYGKK